MRKKKKSKKVKKTSFTKRIPQNQFDNLDLWLEFYKTNKKLPHNRIVCNKCHIDFVNLKGIAMAHARKTFDNDIKRILTESLCKECKPKKEYPKKKVVLTREEMEDRAEQIRRNLPKIDLNRQRESINMVKNKDVCIEVTSFACWRPDVYLDYGCSECSLVKNCACPIKNLKRKPDGRYRKFRKST